MSDILDLLATLPAWAVYLLLAAGGAIENLIPPIPADTFVVVGGLLASRGVVDVWVAGLLTGAANVGGALLVYWMGYRHGRAFFEHGMGRWVLRPGQVRRIEAFYDRWGTHAVFFARFLPGLRAVVPAFAGISRQGFWRTAIPIAAASTLWYGTLIWLGTIAGRNLEAVEAWLSNANRTLLALALVIMGLIGWWWWRTRHEHAHDEAANAARKADPNPENGAANAARKADPNPENGAAKAAHKADPNPESEAANAAHKADPNPENGAGSGAEAGADADPDRDAGAGAGADDSP